jgi:lysophospholipase L1-like esterase
MMINMNKILRKILLPALLLATLFANAQPFASEIAAFKRQDSISAPPKNAILLVGSSSFRMWKDVNSYFPGYTIINRGFGGSTLPDVIRYANDIILPYEPRQVIVYCGDNDLASSDTVTAEMVLQRFETLYNLIRKQYRKTSIAFVALKPSPSRQRLLPKVEKANTLISEFLKKKKRTVFIDVFHPMLLPDGTIMPDIFLEDKLHMNAKGYAIWQKAIAPHLLKEKHQKQNR